MKYLPLAGLLLALPLGLHAGQPMKEPVPVETPFDKGKMELQVGAGAFFSINTDGGSKPDLNDAD